MSDQSSLAEREGEIREAARAWAQVVTREVSSLPEEIAAKPTYRNAAARKIEVRAVAVIPEGLRIDNYMFQFFAEGFLIENGLTGVRRDCAFGMARFTAEQGQVARVEATPIHRVIRREALRWERGRQRGRAAACVPIAPPRTARTPHRAGRSKIHGAAHRASARSGDSGDEDAAGEPPGEPPAPCCNECGAELLSPANPCGLCQLDAANRHRVCRVCGVDITGRKGNAETCGPAHKKAWQRRRKALEVPPLLAVLERRTVDPDPLDGVDRMVFDCLYGNTGLLVAA
jgi:hypothetical protein